MPLVWLGYSLVAAYRVYNGEPFEYPLVGQVVANTLQSPTPSVGVPPAPPAPTMG
jgi:hypothetical protein